MNKGQKVKEDFSQDLCVTVQTTSERCVGSRRRDETREENGQEINRYVVFLFEDSAPSTDLQFLLHPFSLFPIFCLERLGSPNFNGNLKGRINRGKLTGIY